MSIQGTYTTPFEKDGLKFVSYPHRGNGLSLIIEQEKIEKSVQYIQDNKITGIDFHPLVYGNIENIGFLTKIKDYIQSISFTSECRIKDISPLNALENLKYLEFSIDNKIQQTLNFSNFPKLEQAHIVWQKNMINLNTCIRLENLGLYNWNEQDIQSLTTLKELKKLYFNDTKILTSLAGIENFSKLENLSLYNCPKLQSLGDFDNFSNTLEELNIQSCRQITDYTTISKLKNLKYLVLLSSAPAENASFLENLNLKGFGNIDINILDGNVENLLKEPILFKNYTHFNAKNISSLRDYKGEYYLFKKDAEGKFQPFRKIK